MENKIRYKGERNKTRQGRWQDISVFAEEALLGSKGASAGEGVSSWVEKVGIAQSPDMYFGLWFNYEVFKLYDRASRILEVADMVSRILHRSLIKLTNVISANIIELNVYSKDLTAEYVCKYNGIPPFIGEAYRLFIPIDKVLREFYSIPAYGIVGRFYAPISGLLVELVNARAAGHCLVARDVILNSFGLMGCRDEADRLNKAKDVTDTGDVNRILDMIKKGK